MNDRFTDKSWWVIALWSTLAVTIALAISVLVAVVISGFQWYIFMQILMLWWLAFLILIVLIDVVIVLTVQFPLQTISITLLTFASLFTMASAQNTTGQALRSFISERLDLDYLVAAITVFAFLLAFVTIVKTRNNE